MSKVSWKGREGRCVSGPVPEEVYPSYIKGLVKWTGSNGCGLSIQKNYFLCALLVGLSHHPFRPDPHPLTHPDLSLKDQATDRDLELRRPCSVFRAAPTLGLHVLWLSAP